MVSLRLVLAFSVEIAICVFVCVKAWEFTLGRLPLGMLFVAVLLTLMVLRLIMMLVEFMYSYIWRTPRALEESLGLGGALKLMVTEFFAFMLVFCLLLPLSRWMMVRKRGIVSKGSQLPVLFIHGYASNEGIWAPMAAYLWSRGLSNLFTMNLHPKYGDIDDYAQQVAARVNRICNTLQAEKVILVGHSMGGLVARTYVERCGGDSRVAKVITIGTAHHGTYTARLALGINASQMRHSSTWLKELNRVENMPSSIPHVSIYSAHDNVVVPQHSAELGQGKNIRLVGQGHFALLLSKQVGHLVYREVMAA